jgi:hypothetical protein
MAKVGARKVSVDLVRSEAHIDLRPHQTELSFVAVQTIGIICSPEAISNSPIMPEGFISHTDLIPSPLPVW